MKKHALVAVLVAALALVGALPVAAHSHEPPGTGGSSDPNPPPPDHLHIKGLSPAQQGMPSLRGPFPDTVNMEYLGQLTNDELGVSRLIYTGASFLSDIWGWTSPAGEEYAIVGTDSGVAIARITDPANPVYLGTIPTTNTQTQYNWWWDVKTYQGFAYFTTEVVDAGIGVVDMVQLEADTIAITESVPPGTALSDSLFEWYRPDGYRAAHNISVNEDSGFAYLTGVTFDGKPQNSVVIFDLAADAWEPPIVGSIEGIDSHDTQVVSYAGPDGDYAGREIAFVFNGTDGEVGIYDVTNKGSIATISETTYAGAAFTHQGWLTEDQSVLLVGDEEDELFGLSDPTNPDYPDTARTYIWDVSDLDNPSVIGTFDSPEASIDHNLFVKGNYVYQAHYVAGIRVLDASDAANGVLQEVAHMDTEPRFSTEHINWGYNIWVGPWGVYPFFDSGTIAASDGLNGLVLMRLDLGS